MAGDSDASGDSADLDAKYTRYGFYVVLAGIGAVVAIYCIAALRWSNAADVAAAVGAAGSIIGTIVGAYFGLQTGSAGRQRAERQRDVAQERSMTLAAALDPDRYDALRASRRDLFGDKG